MSVDVRCCSWRSFTFFFIYFFYITRMFRVQRGETICLCQQIERKQTRCTVQRTPGTISRSSSASVHLQPQYQAAAAFLNFKLQPLSLHTVIIERSSHSLHLFKEGLWWHDLVSDDIMAFSRIQAPSQQPLQTTKYYSLPIFINRFYQMKTKIYQNENLTSVLRLIVWAIQCFIKARSEY